MTTPTDFELLVIGGASGVGLALLRARLAMGQSVAATVLNDAEERAVAAAFGDKVRTYRLDLSSCSSVCDELSRVLGASSRVSQIVVCAAVAPIGAIELQPIGEFESALSINALAPVAIYQAAIPVLRNSGGRLIFVSSMAGKVAMPILAAYSMSKFALEGAADVMRREAAAQGVKIVLVQPGGIKTPMLDAQRRAISEKAGALSDEAEKLYGDLYRTYQRLNARSCDSASNPDDVAMVLSEALDAVEPRTRYAVGADAIGFLGLAEGKEDRDVDAAIGAIYASA